MGSKIALIVEDDPSIRFFIAKGFSRHGYEVSQAPNGQVALELIKHGLRPSVIVLDLMMPVMDGWDFLEQRTSIPEMAGIPIIVLSALDPANMHAVNVARCLSKPCDLKHLLSIADNLVP